MADVLVSVCEGDGVNSQEQLVFDNAGNDKIASSQEDDPKELEGKKKRLLEELESALVPKDCSSTNPNPNPIIPNPIRPCLGFGIEVIDETALLDSIPKTSKNGKQSRRRANKKTHKRNVTETDDAAVRNISSSSNSNSSKYSRKEMEAMRFVNVSQQRKFWKDVYASLETTVANEYDTLVAAVLNNRQPLPSLPNKKPILTG